MAYAPEQSRDHGITHSSHSPGELSTSQRGIYLLGGLVMAAAGAKPRPNLLLNVVALGADAYLAWRGVEGSCPVKAMIES